MKTVNQLVNTTALRARC